MIEGKSVPLTEARRVAASRIAAYDQAIAILGESPSGTMLRDGRQIWEQFADLLARLDKVIGMLRVDWDTLRRTLHAETEQLRGRGEKS